MLLRDFIKLLFRTTEEIERAFNPQYEKKNKNALLARNPTSAASCAALGEADPGCYQFIPLLAAIFSGHDSCTFRSE